MIYMQCFCVLTISPSILEVFSPEEDAIMQVKKIVYITWKEVVLVRGHTNEF